MINHISQQILGLGKLESKLLQQEKTTQHSCPPPHTPV